jgi:hypothetical protein
VLSNLTVHKKLYKLFLVTISLAFATLTIMNENELSLKIMQFLVLISFMFALIGALFNSNEPSGAFPEPKWTNVKQWSPSFRTMALGIIFWIISLYGISCIRQAMV